MKTNYLRSLIVLFCLFTCQIGSGQNGNSDKAKIEKTVEEFVKFFKAYDWTDYEEIKPKRSFECRLDAIPKLKRMRNPFRDAGAPEFANVVAGLEWFRYSIDAYVSGTKFDKVKEKEGSLFDTPTFKRDKMIEKLEAANSPE